MPCQLRHVAGGKGEATLVERYHIAKPIGVGFRADEHEADGPMGKHKLGAEQHRLLPRPVCQLAAVQATGEAQLIADQ